MVQGTSIQDEECVSGTRDEATKLLDLYYKQFNLLKVLFFGNP